MYGTTAAVIRNPFVKSIFIGAEMNRVRNFSNQNNRKPTGFQHGLETRFEIQSRAVG
jgi:hypothetical protein